MATSYNDVAVTATWVDLTVANAALVSSACVIQRKDQGAFPLYVFFGGGSAPTSDNAGVLLRTLGESVDGTAAKIWVRADQLGGALYTGLKDT